MRIIGVGSKLTFHKKKAGKYLKKKMTQHGLSCRKQPLPISDHSGVIFWVVAYRKFDCKCFQCKPVKKSPRSFVTKKSTVHSSSVLTVNTIKYIVSIHKLQLSGFQLKSHFKNLGYTISGKPIIYIFGIHHENKGAH